MSEKISTELIKELEYLEEKDANKVVGFLPRRLIRQDKQQFKEEPNYGPKSSTERMLRVSQKRIKITRSSSKRSPGREVETD